MPIYNNLSLALRPPLCHPGLACALLNPKSSQDRALWEGTWQGGQQSMLATRASLGTGYTASSFAGHIQALLWASLGLVREQVFIA